MSDQTPLDVEAIRARLEAATPGPWTAHMPGGIHEDAAWVGAPHDGEGDGVFIASTSGHPDGLNDAIFIAAAHTDLRRLLDENARLNAQLDSQREVWKAELDSVTAQRDTYKEAVYLEGNTIEALSARLTAKNAELDECIRASLAAGVEFAEKIGAMRAERDEAIRESAADKARVAELEGESRLVQARAAGTGSGRGTGVTEAQGAQEAEHEPRAYRMGSLINLTCSCEEFAVSFVNGTNRDEMDAKFAEHLAEVEEEPEADLSLIPADLIKSDPDIRGGEPCITGTRIPASEVAGYLADGATWDEVREMLPSLPSLPGEEA